MRNTWKIAVALTLVLGFRGALAQAQPLIAGNTSAFGCGPIYTSDFTTGLTTHSFIPTGAGGPGCTPTPPTDHPNGRGLAIGGTEVFYTELTGSNGFGPTDKIRVATFDSGAGSPDTRSLLNPRPGSGIQDLTFANSILYVLTGYDTQVPIVYGLNLLDGSVIKGPVTITQPSGTDKGVDGFAVLPNGNFLMNNGDESCIYSEYSSVDGHFIGNTINVPGGPGVCTGVDTDGTSLYFLTDFNSITRTNLTGGMTGFNYFSGGDEILIEDISLVHPVTIITGVGDGHFFFTIRDSNDIGSNFDLQAELLKNGTVIAAGLTLCYPSSGITPPPIPRNIPGRDVNIPISLPSGVPLVSGDVLAVRLSARIGTPRATCGGHTTADKGLRFLYDSVGDPSRLPMTIAPNPSQPFYLHSDGTTCTDALGESQPTLTLNRSLSSVAPAGASPRCKEITYLDGRTTNPFVVFSTWFLPPLP